jgi:hypothetical protein
MANERSEPRGFKRPSVFVVLAPRDNGRRTYILYRAMTEGLCLLCDDNVLWSAPVDRGRIRRPVFCFFCMTGGGLAAFYGVCKT